MIQNLLEISGYLGFGFLLIFASIGFMFTWRAFAFAAKLAAAEYQYKALKKATEEAKSKLREDIMKEYEQDSKEKV